MFKVLILLLGLVVSGMTHSQATENSQQRMTATELAAAEQAYAAWFNQLNAHLLESDSLYVQAMGLTASLSATLRELNRAEDPTHLQSLLAQQIKLLNQLIAQPDHSPESIELLRHWCFKQAVVDACQKDILLNQQITLDANNFNAYLQPLNEAIEQKNQELIEHIIKLMSQTQYSQSYLFINEAFNQKLDAYIKNNPIPDSAIQSFLDDQALLSDIPKDPKLSLEDQVRAYFPASIKLSFVYLFDTPNTEPLYQLCNTRLDLFEPCLGITQILINQSNAIRFKGLGYTILMSMHESRGNKDLLRTVQIKELKYKQQIQCLLEASKSKVVMADFLDPNYQEINLLPIDEIKKLDLLANYVYQKNRGDNPKHRNPKACYQSKP